MAARELKLPEGWPDGPLDEVLGELVHAAFVACREPGSFVAESDSPASTRLDGWFDLRNVGAVVAPHIRELIKMQEAYRDGR
ncbi:hypothetical protein [Nocardia sp. NBC_00511]|uniref:hypothetical protein n=1 Tax=Nocardia sp. NBC_00511 TaxID=2903591 RepID=UPI0030E40A92